MRRLGVGAAAAAVTTACVLVGTAVVGAPTAVTASRIPVTITATSLDVGQLVYQGTASVETTAGTVTALELHVTDATFHGLVLDLPCVPIPVGGLTGRTTTTGLTTTPALTVYATDVVATIGTSTVRISSTDPAFPPPPAGTVLRANGSLTDPAMVALLAASADLHAPTLRTTASFCTPTGAAGLVGGAPFVLTPAPGTPSPASPSESSAAPSGGPAPSDHPTGTSGPSGPSPEEPGTSTAPPEPSPSVAPEPAPAEPSSVEPSPTP